MRIATVTTRVPDDARGVMFRQRRFAGREVAPPSSSGQSRTQPGQVQHTARCQTPDFKLKLVLSQSLTQLRPLKHLQLRMRVQQPLHRLNILFILESRKDVQIIQRLGQVPIQLSQNPPVSKSTPL